MKFDTQIALPLQFHTENRPFLGFEFYGVKEIKEDEGDPKSDVITVKCEDNEAQAWGVYAIVRDGELDLPVWIADLEDKEMAKRLRDLLTNIKDEITKNTGSETGDFIHPEISCGLVTLSNGQPYNYLIEQTATQPENYRLYIYEADCDQEYQYETKEDAERDIKLAEEIFGLELINTSN